MNRTWCEREGDVVRELRVGALSPELLQHLRSCAVCAETQSVAQVMLQAASLRNAEYGLPDAGLMWRRVETRKKEIALKRAAQPLIFMRALSVVWVAIFAAWFLHYFWRAGFVELFPNRNVLASESASFAALIAVLAIVIGAGYLLHDSRRSVEGIAST
jgi:hypothetical protein